jgi:heat-inducible transcriptional repressor
MLLVGYRPAMETNLPPRAFEVLHSIVQSYVETGEPVASRAIAQRRRDNLSAATIRNIMADLADSGYLDQPHTSAGRVPTEKAFRHFAESLVASHSTPLELGKLREELYPIDSIEQRASHSSHILTELTRNVGIVAAIPAASQQLDQIELLMLPDRRILMVLVTSDHMVRNRVIKLDQPVTPEDLLSIRNYVNRNFSGWTLTDIRAELNRRLEEESAKYDEILRKLTLLYDKGLLSAGLTPQVYMEGASNLVGLDLHLTSERLRDLFRALEEKKRILQLLDSFLGNDPGRVCVRVGLAEIHPSMRTLSLIGFSVAMPGGLSARFAVLGPMRMNYPRVISAVRGIGQAFESLPQ